MSTVLVTGAADGIGRATAARLAAEEFRVWGAVRDARGRFELERLGSPELDPIELDLADRDSIAAAVERIASDGGLDAVVSTAGEGEGGPLELLTCESLGEQLQLNVVGPLALARTAVHLLRRSDDPRVIFVGPEGDPGTPGSASANELCGRAIEVIADALRAELRDDGIAVSLVEPAPTGADPDDVAEVIVRALRSPTPSARYPVGLGAQIAGRARGIVGDRVFGLFAVGPLRP